MSQEQSVIEATHRKLPLNIDVTTALKQMIDIMNNVEHESRQRLLLSLATLFDLSHPTPLASGISGVRREGIPFSEVKTVSPKEFLFQKKPQSDVERVTVLAYYLTHNRNTPYFKTLDISKLNTEAAQPKFSNAAYAVENAAKYGYLVPANKGNKQLSSAGDLFVEALPDREAAKQAKLAARPKRKPKKGPQSKEKSLRNLDETNDET
jgi:hypothetical protein